MKYYLAKTDPKTYSIFDFEKEKITTWDGVRNPTAVMFLKQMKAGDKVIIYHSGGESTIVGLAMVIGNSRPDTKNSKSWLIDFEFVEKFNQPLITLQQIKQSGKFTEFKLVKQGRLSTMDVPQYFIDWFNQQSKSKI